MVPEGAKISIYSIDKENPIQLTARRIVKEEGLIVAEGDLEDLTPGIYMMRIVNRVSEAKLVKKSGNTCVIFYAELKTGQEKKPRFGYNKKIKVRMVNDGNNAQWFTAIGKDISSDDVSFYSPKMIYPKEKVELMMPITDQLKLPGVTKWFNHGKSAFHVGVTLEIDKGLKEKIIEHLANEQHRRTHKKS